MAIRLACPMPEGIFVNFFEIRVLSEGSLGFKGRKLAAFQPGAIHPKPKHCLVTQKLKCSSFFLMAYFLLMNCNLHLSTYVPRPVHKVRRMRVSLRPAEARFDRREVRGPK